MDFIRQNILPHANYWVYILIMMTGLFAMISKNNLIKKLIGMSIFQTAIILFYISAGVKKDSTIPVVDHHLVHEHFTAASQALDGNPAPLADVPKIVSRDYDNPLPHVLMLTAIVVGVATLGVALALTQNLYRDYGTIEESEILAQISPQRNRNHHPNANRQKLNVES